MSPTTMTPQTISNNGVITATDSDGNTHRYHTDPKEASQHFYLVDSLCAGADELGLLLRNEGDRRGRTDIQVTEDWFRKVEANGLPHEIAVQFLEERLSLG